MSIRPTVIPRPIPRRSPTAAKAPLASSQAEQRLARLTLIEGPSDRPGTSAHAEVCLVDSARILYVHRTDYDDDPPFGFRVAVNGKVRAELRLRTGSGQIPYGDWEGIRYYGKTAAIPVFPGEQVSIVELGTGRLSTLRIP